MSSYNTFSKVPIASSNFQFTINTNKPIWSYSNIHIINSLRRIQLGMRESRGNETLFVDSQTNVTGKIGFIKAVNSKYYILS